MIYLFLSFFIPFIIYLLTLAPTVTYGDNPELIATAASLGVAHPPGYPLFCLLGKLFSFIPFGTLPWRINFMAAVLGALTILILFLICRELNFSPLISVTVSWVLAFSRVFWLYSIQAEVFSLNNFLLALIIYFALKKNWRGVLLFLGLGLANQQNIILVVPALFYFNWRKILSFKKIFSSIFYLLPGLLLYFYLPIVSLTNPAFNCGDPSSLKNFWNVISRRAYLQGDTFSLPMNIFKSSSKWWQHLSWYFNHLNIDFTLGIFILILVGFWYSWKINRKIFYFLFCGWLFMGPLMLFTNIFPLNDFRWIIQERLILGASLFFVLWLGFGLKFLDRGLSGKLKFIFIFLPLLLITENLGQVNLSSFYYGKDLARNILKSLPAKSILFTRHDNPFFQILYFQNIEKLRPDVKTLYRNPMEWQIGLYQKNNPEKLDFSETLKNRRTFSLPYQVPSYEAFFVRTVLNNFQKFPVFMTDPADIFAKNQIPWGILVKIVDNRGLTAIKNHLLEYDAWNSFVWSIYEHRGDYNFVKVRPETKNLILIYWVARDFKGALP